jgi:hypothetical protein
MSQVKLFFTVLMAVNARAAEGCLFFRLLKFVGRYLEGLSGRQNGTL